MSGEAAPRPPTPAAPALVVERPPPGLARGRYAGPFWLLSVLGLIAAALTLGFYVRHFRRRNRT